MKTIWFLFTRKRGRSCFFFCGPDKIDILKADPAMVEPYTQNARENGNKFQPILTHEFWKIL